MLKIIIYTLRTISILSFIYFMLVAFYSGIKTSFLWFFITFSIIAMAISFILPSFYHSKNIHLAVCGKILIILIWTAAALFLLVQIKIISYASLNPPEHADYIIVLGAQVRGSSPSLTLLNRIEAAYEYLVDNPNTKVICSGGQGSGEEITEAYAISSILIEKGISSDRIFLEENSTNTVQNLMFSSEYIDKEKDTVIIISSDFHIYRALRIAERIGIKNGYGYSKKELLLTTPGYYIREFFAICKDLINK